MLTQQKQTWDLLQLSMALGKAAHLSQTGLVQTLTTLVCGRILADRCQYISFIGGIPKQMSWLRHLIWNQYYINVIPTNTSGKVIYNLIQICVLSCSIYYTISYTYVHGQVKQLVFLHCSPLQCTLPSFGVGLVHRRTSVRIPTPPHGKVEQLPFNHGDQEPAIV